MLFARKLLISQVYESKVLELLSFASLTLSHAFGMYVAVRLDYSYNILYIYIIVPSETIYETYYTMS